MVNTGNSQNQRAARRGSGLRIPQVPIEWMGVANWKLPSGKALAEFALQAGFLAPLLLGDGPFWRKRQNPKGKAVESASASEATADKEVVTRPGMARQTR